MSRYPSIAASLALFTGRPEVPCLPSLAAGLDALAPKQDEASPSRADGADDNRTTVMVFFLSKPSSRMNACLPNALLSHGTAPCSVQMKFCADQQTTEAVRMNAAFQTENRPPKEQ
ncbi:hypothetical protein CI238_03311 [Colletotrichum incanum]|uniref:Uncharacterized protein n=1 Tax=Colletotrichum incanum TaxID=1573173 RepID=A0A167B9D2_COLIC|nr:hypothetical protein CI238_03311 [Colletotrichum incanum]